MEQKLLTQILKNIVEQVDNSQIESSDQLIKQLIYDLDQLEIG